MGACGYGNDQPVDLTDIFPRQEVVDIKRKYFNYVGSDNRSARSCYPPDV